MGFPITGIVPACILAFISLKVLDAGGEQAGTLGALLGVLPPALGSWQVAELELSAALLQRPSSEEEAALKIQLLQSALQQAGDRVIKDLFVAWSAAHGMFYFDVAEAESAFNDFVKSMHRIRDGNMTEHQAFWPRAPRSYSSEVTSDPPTDRTAHPKTWQQQQQQPDETVQEGWQQQQQPDETAQSGGQQQHQQQEPLQPQRHKVRPVSHLRWTRRLSADPLPVFRKDYPRAYSHQEQGNLSPVVHQGLSCGSCWANSASSALDAALVIYRKMYFNLTVVPWKYSRQIIVDCANQDFAGDFYVNDNGCNLGSAGDALYFAVSYAIPLEYYYPYTSGATSTAGECDANMTRLSPPALGGWWLQTTGVVHYTDVDLDGFPLPISENNMKAAVFNQPVVIYWSVGVNFLNLKGRIVYTVDMQYDIYSGCFNYAGSCDHAMLLVGYDSGNGTWLIQNSWGTSWGDRGFFRAEMTHDEQGPCGMHYYVVAPALNFTHLPPAVLASPPSPPSPPSPKPPPSPPSPRPPRPLPPSPPIPPVVGQATIAQPRPPSPSPPPKPPRPPVAAGQLPPSSVDYNPDDGTGDV